MRRHDPDALTRREREVLDLIRRGLTNEEIAQRLDISLDGAKYHVSQILSKLGVATREEAAVWVPEDRRAWWAHWPLWAKIAGAATAALAMAAGVAILVYDPTSGKSEEDRSAEEEAPTVEEAYGRIRESVSRPGTVLHTTIRDTYTPGEDGANLVDALAETVELWIDGGAGALRSAPPRPIERQAYTVEGDAPYMIAGDQIYQFSPADNTSRRLRVNAADFVLCPGTTDLLLAFLLCGGMDITDQITPKDKVRVVSGKYDGRRGPVLEFERAQQTLLSSPCEFPAPPASGQPRSSPLVADSRWVSRIYLDGQSFLPFAGVTELWLGGERCGTATKEYQHEYLDRRDLPNDWFDPRPID